MMVPKVKVCGITRLEDAELAVELGAWAVGMVLFEGSPRRCSAAEALRISSALRRRVEVCGVFVNAPLEDVVGTAQELGLTLLQLHGDEGPAFCAEAAHRSGARVIKAVQVSTIGDVRDVERFHVDYHLLDARAKTPGRRGLRGGTGETFDWSLLEARRSKAPLILSGGLSAGNVAEAIARAERIGPRARPFAVDTASGTEAAPGHKDPDALRAFFEQVRSTDVPDGDAEAGADAGDAGLRDTDAGDAGLRDTDAGDAGLRDTDAGDAGLRDTDAGDAGAGSAEVGAAA